MFAPLQLHQTTDGTGVAAGDIGMKYQVDDRDPRNEAQVLNSASKVDVRMVRNDSGGELEPGQTCIWNTADGDALKDAKGGGAADRIRGIVSPYLSANVPANYLFPMVVGGPTKAQKSSADITLNAQLVGAASGEVKAQGGTDPEFGYAMEGSASTAAGTLIRVFLNNIE